MRYPGLDGVRAIAVLLVFSVHTISVWTLNIGWVGVQVFFVLSGFLITGILYDSREQPNRWRNFYTRRALRIFPLYYFVWFLIAALTPMLRLEWHRLDALWLLYLGNYIQLFAGNDSLHQLSSSHSHFRIVVEHFWSLAVEEQFYLLWPMIVFAIGRRQTLIRLCIAAVPAIFALRLLLDFVAPAWMLHLDLLRYSVFTQADAFLIGGFMALCSRGPEWQRMRSSGAVLFLGSAGLIAAHQIFQIARFHTHGELSTSSPWVTTFGFTLIDLAAAGLILMAMQPRTIVNRLCSLRFIARLGVISYGFYVYHMILLHAVLPAVPHHGRSALFAPFVLAFDFGIVYLVSDLSYRYLETPFLRLKDRLSAPSNTWTVTVPE